MIAETPAKLKFLYEPKRYKVLYGGRGKGASWGIADALLINGSRRPLRWLCARETQESIGESVHALLSARIVHLGLQRFYEVQLKRIISMTFKAGEELDPLGGRCGFAFAGLRHNTNGIKSYEGFDGVWIEEAENVSKESWNILIPTLRKPGSEIWVSFNPALDTDNTYQRFVVHPPPPESATVVRLNWRDNPFFPEVLRKEMADLRASDPDTCDHVYEGHPRSAIVGSIYEHEIKRAEREERITRVPYDASKPVDTFWDLGFGDLVSIWFAQSIAFEYRVIDYYSDSRKPMDFYLQVLQGRGYTYGTAYFPWDGGAVSLGSGRSIEEMARAKGFKTRVMTQWRVADGINAVRTVFPQLWFDSDKCADGLASLRRYQWGVATKNGVTTREPLHDIHSHPADALRTLGVAIRPPEKKKEKLPQTILEPPRLPGTYTPFG